MRRFWFGDPPQPAGAAASAELDRLFSFPIATAKPGTVKLAGRVRGLGEVLRAPMSGRPAVYFDVSVLVDDTRVLSWLRWQDWVEQTRSVAFELEDDTGRAVVRFPPQFPPQSPEPADDDPEVLVWLPEGVVTDTTERDAPPDVLSLLPSVDFDRAERNNSVHVVERVVGIGDLITVGGYATREVTPSGTGRGFRSPPTALVVSAIYEQPLIIASTSLVAKWCDPDR